MTLSLREFYSCLFVLIRSGLQHCFRSLVQELQEVLEVHGVFIGFLSLSDMVRRIVVFHLSPGECGVLMSTLEPFSVAANGTKTKLIFGVVCSTQSS